MKIVVIGGGAAGIFAAIRCAENNPEHEVIVLEKTRQLLAKVRISGGGRCNVTHAQFDPKKLIQHYPRGSKELLGPFYFFQPQDTIAWFEGHNVKLKTEGDGRMFPTTDSSETIISCFLNTAKKLGVTICLEQHIQSIEKTETGFIIHFSDAHIACDALILATGSSPQGHAFAKTLGHTIIPSVPSLFTFNVPTSALLDLSGIAVPNVELSVCSFKQRGDLLLTHFGFSGPCALKLSAWAARELHACHYKTELLINWLPDLNEEKIYQSLLSLKKQKPHRQLEHENLFRLPQNLWKHFTTSGVSLSHTPHEELKNFAKLLNRSSFAVEGKTTNKQEFVTCGGVSLKEIDFKTMQSRLIPRLYFAGEILDIDGVTGGFNFQSAWTTASLAALDLSN